METRSALSPAGPTEVARFPNHEVAVSQSIAVINAGSSSIKFALYDAVREEICFFRGQIGGIGVAPRLKVADPKGEIVEERAFASEGFDHDAAMREILSVGAKLLRGEPVAAFGHRVVHGGVRYDSPVRVTSDVLDDLARLAPLAPLHQPHNLAPIRTILNVAPQIPQVACFDTAFHRRQSYLAQAFALPRRFADAGVRRYGFHGLSYEFLVARFGELAPTLANARIVIAHLGNGASMCAVKDGRSVATTMGFTAVDGLMMGTRCGAIDPGVILYMMQEHGMDAAAIEDLIYRQSGLLGVSGISSDMRRSARFSRASGKRSDRAVRVSHSQGARIAGRGLGRHRRAGVLRRDRRARRDDPSRGRERVAMDRRRTRSRERNSRASSGSAPTTRLFRFGRSQPTRSGSSRAIRRRCFNSGLYFVISGVRFWRTIANLR